MDHLSITFALGVLAAWVLIGAIAGSWFGRIARRNAPASHERFRRERVGVDSASSWAEYMSHRSRVERRRQERGW